MIRKPLLRAGGGEMTVGRRTAGYVFGAFQVRLPQDRNIQATTTEHQQDGYINRPENLPQGRFDLGFVRADVLIDLDIQKTNLEQSIDSALKRVEGAVFVEREITGPDLGRYRPTVDYTIDDQAAVQIWGRIITLPITSIDMVTDPNQRAGWKVRVGGQMIADAEALRSHNDQLEAQVEQERRQLMRAQQATATQAASASASAAVANTAAATASVKATTAQQGVDRLQAQIDAAQNRAIAENRAFAEAQAEYLNLAQKVGIFVRKSDSSGSGAGLSIILSENRRTATFTYNGSADAPNAEINVVVRYDALVAHSQPFIWTFYNGQSREFSTANFAESIYSIVADVYRKSDYERILARRRRANNL